MSQASQQQQSVPISVTASDSQDSAVRFWYLFVDTPPGNYLGGGKFSNSPAASATLSSGGKMPATLVLTSGPHDLYFIVTQSGGSPFGTYAGTLTVSGAPYQFSGVDVSNAFAVTINVPMSSTTAPPTVVPPITTPPTTTPPASTPPTTPPSKTTAKPPLVTIFGFGLSTVDILIIGGVISAIVVAAIAVASR